MAWGSRIFGILEMELSQHLVFSFSIKEHLTRPGSSTLRPQDRFRFTVWISNNSAIPLCALRGAIAPTAAARFPVTRFEVPRLLPSQREQLATIEAQVTRHPGKGCVRFDQLGTVSVSTTADLSKFRIERWRPLTYVRTA